MENQEGEKLFELLDNKFGTDIFKRVAKLNEEYGELIEVVEHSGELTNEKFADLFIDELSDVNIIVCHMAHILGYSQFDLLSMAKDKIVKRIGNPDYKRHHKHEPEKTCSMCRYYRFGEINGIDETCVREKERKSTRGIDTACYYFEQPERKNCLQCKHCKIDQMGIGECDLESGKYVNYFDEICDKWERYKQSNKKQ